MWPARVAVCIPTVAARAAHLALTLRQWRDEFRAAPFVSVQDPSWPLCHASHTKHVTGMLRAALDTNPAATHLLLWEDDVDADPNLPGLLPAMLDGRVWSLWAAGLRFYPPDVVAELRAGLPLTSRRAVPARQLSGWHGTLAILLPRQTVEDICGWPSQPAGWDILLRTWLRAHRQRLWLPVPNLAEHRGTLSAVAPTGTSGLSRSASWRLPVLSQEVVSC